MGLVIMIHEFYQPQNMTFLKQVINYNPLSGSLFKVVGLRAQSY